MYWEDIKDFGTAMCIVCVAIVVIGAPLMYGANRLMRWECSSKWENSGMSTQYSFVGGCQISVDGGKTYIPASSYREIH